MTESSAWEAFLDDIEAHVSPEWSRNARTHGTQPWIRLIALVDIHHQLTSPQIVEKIAMTMVDLAHERESEVAGWGAIHEAAKGKRKALRDRVVATAPEVLPGDLVHLFTRSLTPVLDD